MIQALYQALQTVHPWERVSEIQSIKENLAQTLNPLLPTVGLYAMP